MGAIHSLKNTIEPNLASKAQEPLVSSRGGGKRERKTCDEKGKISCKRRGREGNRKRSSGRDQRQKKKEPESALQAIFGRIGRKKRTKNDSKTEEMHLG